MSIPLVNIDKPRYDQSTYSGRAKHFFVVTNPLNVLATSAQLENSKRIVDDFCQGRLTAITEDDLWRAKYLYDSAFHPVSGEKMNVVGRMSCQVPMNVLIGAGMLTWYRSTIGTIFWQWFNQSFMALVNYTNRSGGSVNQNQLATAYVSATGGALVASLGLNKIANKFPPLLGRFVPFVAVALANCINVPLMRSHELKTGITLFNNKDEPVGESVPAAKRAISQVAISRIMMAAPGMTIPPIIMSILERRWPSLVCWIFKKPIFTAPLQTIFIALCMTFATPLCCALFPQKSSIKVASLEPALRNRLISQGYEAEDRLFYNKGL